MSISNRAAPLTTLLLAAASGLACAGDRDVQFQRIDLYFNYVSLHNFGTDTVDLSGWQLGTDDFTEARRFTAPGGFDGVTLTPGESLYIYFNNDAPPVPGVQRFDAAALGGEFVSLDHSAFALQVFSPGADGTVAIDSTSDLNDHVQWGVTPEIFTPNAGLCEQAVNAGLWTVETDYVQTVSGMRSIELTDETGGVLHGPEHYAIEDDPCLSADINSDGIIDNGDITTFISFFLAQSIRADINGDGVLCNGDIGAFVNVFLSCIG